MKMDLSSAANENYEHQKKLEKLENFEVGREILIELFANNFAISFEVWMLIERTSYSCLSFSLPLSFLLALKAAAILLEFSKTIFID